MLIPEKAEDFTPEWLEAALHLETGDIQQVTTRSSEADSGLVSLIVFLELTLAAGVDAPVKLVGKIAPTHAGAREVATAFSLFAREQNFYQDIASRLSIPSPKAYYCDHDDSGLGVLLLEDCSHMKAIDQTAEQPTTLAELEIIVDGISELAISSWEADWLASEPEIMGSDHPTSKAYFGGIQAGFPAFLESEFMSEVPAEFDAVLQRLSDDYHAVASAKLPNCQSLCHLDLRLANVFLDQARDGSAVFFDWASMYSGRTAQDLGNLIGSGYSTPFRRQHEEALIKRYHAKLLAAGIHNYTFEDCWLDYKHGLLIGLRLLPMSLGDLDVSDEGGGAVLRKIMRVLSQAVLDHGGTELIDEVLEKRPGR